MKISFQNTFFTIATIFSLFAIMIFAQSILFPIFLSLMLAFILYPVGNKLESWGLNKLFASFLALFGSFLLVIGLLFVFSTQLIELSGQLTDFREKITTLFTDVLVYINKNVSFMSDFSRDNILEEARKWLKNSAAGLVGETVSNTSNFLTGLVTITIYTYLILIYRKSLTKAFVSLASEENREKVKNMLSNIQKVGQKYVSGMFLLILILGSANSIGLWIIGIDSPILFGFLAATLSIIPYIGTTLGATIPVLYAFMSHDSLWIPLSVAILFWAIQLIESNFLSPKIVGSSLNVNPLAAILSLIIGAAVWGVAGMVLFLPFAAMLKVFCQEFDQLKPVAMMINDYDDNSSEEESKWVKKVKSWFKKGA